MRTLPPLYRMQILRIYNLACRRQETKASSARQSRSSAKTSSHNRNFARRLEPAALRINCAAIIPAVARLTINEPPSPIPCTFETAPSRKSPPACPIRTAPSMRGQKPDVGRGRPKTRQTVRGASTNNTPLTSFSSRSTRRMLCTVAVGFRGSICLTTSLTSGWSVDV